MKISEIITEEVDMSWQAEIDDLYNPEALEHANMQMRRQDMLNKMSPGTTIFHKPVRQSETSFSNLPPKDQTKSAGYLGNVEVAIRAKHISKEQGDELTDIN
jgi:hypothetical protein